MTTRLKTRPFKRGHKVKFNKWGELRDLSSMRARPLDRVRIIVVQGCSLTPAEYSEIMKERERERHGEVIISDRRIELAAKRRQRRPAVVTGRIKIKDRNKRYPLHEIIAAREQGRKLQPQKTGGQ